MPESGNTYTIDLKQAHLNWGTHRYTATRPEIPGEGYIPIPARCAEAFDIRVGDTYRAVFSDGFDAFVARAAGNSAAGGIYAKQFQGDGDLKAFGRWFRAVGAEIGDSVRVTFLDENTVEFALLR